jgi:hypothetical protein
MPAGDDVGHGMPVSDEFTNRTLGFQWYHRESASNFFSVGDGALRMKGQGSRMADAAMLSCRALNHAYEASVEVKAPTGGQAGLLLSSGDGAFGLLVQDGRVQVQWCGCAHPLGDARHHRAWLKVRNVRHDASASWSVDGTNWVPCDRGTDLSSSRARISLFAAGEGEAEFRQFAYRGLE